MSGNRLSPDQAAVIFNDVVANHPSLKIKAVPAALFVGDKIVMFRINDCGQKLGEEFLDAIFPKVGTGVYYHYTTFQSFDAIIASGKLRFFSTRKKDSIGEFIPFCKDHELDGYWRLDPNGKPEGDYEQMMDDLFYKSFVASPTENAETLWEVFANKHQGVRLKFQITVADEYNNFRRMAYQNIGEVSVVNDLLKEFRSRGYRFNPLRVSVMCGFYQLSKFHSQNEHRLIAKRIPGYEQCFPFSVSRDLDQDCNYIDCDLVQPTCQAFQIKLLEVTPGRLCDVQAVDDQIKQSTKITGLKKTLL